jgi:hypothetical protein
MGRRQQTHPLGCETGGKAHGEQIPVGADVQDVFARREAVRQLRRVGEKLPRSDGLTPAVGNDRGR